MGIITIAKTYIILVEMTRKKYCNHNEFPIGGFYSVL